MSNKSILGLNLLWAAVAVAAFLAGRGAPAGSDAATTSGKEGSLGVPAEGGGPSAVAGSAAIGAGSAAPDAEGASAVEIERRMASALSEVDPLRRKSLIAEMLLNLTPDMVPGMLAAFENADRGDETNTHFRDFLYAWGRLGGEDAIAYAMDESSERRDRWGAATAVAGWAANDPEAAKAFVAAVDEKNTRQWLHYGVFREVLRTDLDGAIAYSEQNELSRARGQQIDQLGRAVFEKRGMDGMMEWMEGIDHAADGNDLLAYKRYAANMALDRLAGEDADMAASWIAEHAGEPYVTADGLERAARRARGPISEELEWIAALPDEIGQRRHALGERFEDFIRDDFAAAGKWLAAQPLGPTYDEAIQDYARSAARDDPEAAMAWAAQISDPKLRAETLKRIQG